MPDCFPVFFSAFFSLIESEFRNKGDGKLRQKNQKKVCLYAKRRDLCYHNVSRDENPQRENEMDEFWRW